MHPAYRYLGHLQSRNALGLPRFERLCDFGRTIADGAMMVSNDTREFER